MDIEELAEQVEDLVGIAGTHTEHGELFAADSDTPEAAGMITAQLAIATSLQAVALAVLRLPTADVDHLKSEADFDRRVDEFGAERWVPGSAHIGSRPPRERPILEEDERPTQ